MRSCDTEFVKYLQLIVKNFVVCGKFTNVLKKFNVFSIHKTSNVSYLSLVMKVFERLTIKLVLEFLNQKKLLSPHQSCFLQNGFSENLLLSITHISSEDFN